MACTYRFFIFSLISRVCKNLFSGSPKRPEEPIVEHVPLDYTPERKRLYQVQMGMGYLDLPQVELNGTLKKEVLQTKNVYILDCTSDIYLWVGKNANRLVKMAGQVCWF